MEQFTHDETVRRNAEAFIKKHDLTHAEFAARVSDKFTATRITKYLNLNKEGRVPESDMPKVEQAIRAFLRHAGRIDQVRASLFINSVSIDVASTLSQIRRTGDVGLIHSDGGLGKTSGATLFCCDHPNTLMVTVRQYACGASAVEDMLFMAYLENSLAEWPGNIKRMMWIEQQLRGTERLIIIDDAELMDISGFRSAFALHDATGVPIAFIGNSEIIDKIRKQDKSGKMISRIGMLHNARMKDDAEATACHLIKLFAPGSGDELVEVVTDVVTRFGHCRRARKQLSLAAIIYEGMPGKKDWLDAFAAAETKLIPIVTQPISRRNRR
jgi:DNA transposition AAA+ family ATPase